MWQVRFRSIRTSSPPCRRCWVRPEAIAARGLRLTGWVANQIDPEMPHQADNVQALQQHLSAPLLGVVPWMSVASPALAADAIDFSMLDAWPRASH